MFWAKDSNAGQKKFLVTEFYGQKNNLQKEGQLNSYLVGV